MGPYSGRFCYFEEHEISGFFRGLDLRIYSLVGLQGTRGSGPSGRIDEAMEAETATRAIREALIENCMLLVVRIDDLSIVKVTKEQGASQ
jgi:hypothetical protein